RTLQLFTYKTTIDTERKPGTAYPLLSGGLDSAVATLIAKEKFEDVQPIFINRGQRAYKKEREAVEKICKLLGIKPAKEINVPFEWYIEAKKKDPKAFPFGRNLVLLSVAASYVAINGGGTIITGFTGDDVGDASEEFVKTFNENLRYAIDDNTNLEVVRVEAPLIKISKAQVIRLAYEKGRKDILENTWSCYESGEEYDGLHCGLCSNCKKRKRAFQESGLKDPTNYKN
ncbi:7-cyano-7-deazaguanine synthase, partial [bacterium]|nr:7-cyano-7-deazaguanine synthase [bacterium]